MLINNAGTYSINDQRLVKESGGVFRRFIDASYLI